MKALYLSVLPALLLAPLTSAVTTASNGVTCRLKAVLKFPKASEGVHKDSVQVLERKAGGEGKVCSSENQRTSWGCTHHGDAFFNATAGVRTAGTARVFNAVGKQFVLRVSHDIIEEDVLRNPTATANSPARLFIRVNNKLLRKFKYKDNNKEYSVQVNCNDKCDCTAERIKEKKGIIINAGSVCRKSVEHFNDVVSWFYNYRLTPDGWHGDWAVQNDIEFVPMISNPWLMSANSTWGDRKCYFAEESTQTLCELQDVIDVINVAKSTGVKMEKLMGFNEMYNNPPPEDLTPQLAASYWGKYVQPAAIATNLVLVSPTVNARLQGTAWFAAFLQECYDLRDPTVENYCDVDLIKKFAVHQYDCKESLWKSWYGGDNSQMIMDLGVLMGNHGGRSEEDWLKYLRERELWVTETSCYWERVNPTTSTWNWDFPHLNSKEQCLRITGQMEDTHGQGSIATMEELDNIERYAWWTIWNKNDIKSHFLTYKSGELTPTGKGYLKHQDGQNVYCEFPGTRLDARDAVLSIGAEIITCSGTGGTEMIRYV